MNKAGVKTRDIRFTSLKSNEAVLVHSEPAMQYAKSLDENKQVQSYETNKPLDIEGCMVSQAGIRKEYYQMQWTSDFYIVYRNETVAVRELITKTDLTKRSIIEKMQLSCSYWEKAGVFDWKMVLVK